MNGSGIALDTNEVIAVLNNTGDARRWIADYPIVHLPVPVVGELLFGAMNSRRPNENRKRIEALVARCRVLDVNVVTAEVYANVRVRLKQAGKPYSVACGVSCFALLQAGAEFFCEPSHNSRLILMMPP